jgi:type IV pilus assembly protein PilN
MIRINLLPLKDAERAVGRRQQQSVLMLALTLAVLMMVVPFVIQARRLAALDAEIERTQAEIRQFEERVKEVQELDRLQKDLEAKLRVIRDLHDKRVGPARMLVDFAAAVPDTLWLIDLTENKGAATLTGVGLDNETIARFMRQLQGSGYFYGVDLVETSQSTIGVRSGSGSEQVSLTRFIINASIDYFGRSGRPNGADAGAEAATPEASKDPVG